MSARSPLAVRRLDVEDDALLDAYMSNTALVFLAPWEHSAAHRDHRRPVYRRQRLSAAFDGDALVGTYRSWDWEVTVPGGGSVTADAISSVTVRPSHRRRGALRGMITADLADAHARGVPAAVLIAAEATIYGRFGFGIATRTANWEVSVREAHLADHAPRGGTVEVTGLGAVRDVLPAVFERGRRPGETDRDDDWWDGFCRITPRPDDKPRPAAVAVHRDDTGTPQGYAVWEWKEEWRDGVPVGTATVRDLFAATRQAYATLWGFLTELDLVATVQVPERAVDEVLPHLLTDARAARVTRVADHLWARLLDPVAALSARGYESPGRATLEVTDPQGWAAGVLTLEVAADGRGVASAAPGAAPDLTLPVGVLSSLWLGGGDLTAAADAGRVAEHVPGAVDRVARLLRTTREPWTGSWF